MEAVSEAPQRKVSVAVGTHSALTEAPTSFTEGESSPEAPLFKKGPYIYTDSSRRASRASYRSNGEHLLARTVNSRAEVEDIKGRNSCEGQTLNTK